MTFEIDPTLKMAKQTQGKKISHASVHCAWICQKQEIIEHKTIDETTALKWFDDLKTCRDEHSLLWSL